LSCASDAATNRVIGPRYAPPNRGCSVVTNDDGGPERRARDLETHANARGHRMKIRRRQFLGLTAGALALPALSRLARADAYPSRPVRLIVGFPPGAATDVIGRLMADALSRKLGQQFFVENKPGVASNVAAETVIRAAPDGYTLLAMTVTNAVNATLYTNLNFDFLRDTAPVAGTIKSVNVLEVNPALPITTVPEFIAYAKANPGKLNYASQGIGTAPNMAAELFKMMTGVDIVHVPYKSFYMPDLLSNQVQCAFTPIPFTIGVIRDGRIRAIAVTGTAPSPALPGIPPIAQFVPGYEANIWHGIAAPKGTPDDIVGKLNTNVNAILAEPEMQAKLANLGAEPMPFGPADYRRFIADQVAKWGKVVKFAGMKPA
jgi:tripartite-type tricarboxylate transporter receptor subunit TctC